MFQLDAYLARINYHGRRCATHGVLVDLHEAHCAAIPFENLDVLLGKPILLDSASIFNKLVVAKRGGYCFEQNELFAQALEALGFNVTRLAARVRYRATSVLPRTHIVLRVDVERDQWLADVGFGGEGPLHPIRLHDGIVDRQGAWTYRLLRDHGHWVLRLHHGSNSLDLYAFDEAPQLPVDYEMANWFTSTHPTSIFRAPSVFVGHRVAHDVRRPVRAPLPPRPGSYHRSIWHLVCRKLLRCETLPAIGPSPAPWSILQGILPREATRHM